MEPVTHFLTGACLGRAGFNRRAAYATLAMTLAAEAPDLDVLWSWRGPVAGFEHHRGITHTFIAAPVVAAVVTLFCYGVHRLRRQPPSVAPHWLRLWIYAWLATLSHLLLDFTNNYGVRPFFPFQPRWYSWDIVFIFEPMLFVLMLGGLVVPGLLGLADREISKKRVVFRGRGWAIAALVGVAVLYAWRGTEHARAVRLLQQSAWSVGGSERPVLRVAAEPFPINPFHWQGVVETDLAYQLADVDTRTDTVNADETRDVLYKPPVTPAVAAAKQSWLGRVYLDWSQFPLVEDVGAGSPPAGDHSTGAEDPHLEQVDFHDVRYGYSDWFGRSAYGARGDGRRRRPLSGSVYVAPNGQIEATYMNDRPQN